MRGGAIAGHAEGQRVRVLSRGGEEVSEIPIWTCLGDEDGERRRRDLADRREILRRVVGQALIDELIERMAARDQDQRVTIGWRLRERLGSDDAAGAGTVVDDGLLAPSFCQRLAER